VYRELGMISAKQLEIRLVSYYGLLLK